MLKLPRRFCTSLIALAPLAMVCAAAAQIPDVACSSAVDGCSTGDGTANCCGNCCRAICYPKTEQFDEKKSCRIVKCEKLAVPAITLPWEQGGSPLTLFSCLRQLTHSHSAKCKCTQCGGTVECCEACRCCDECCLCGPTRCGTVRLVKVLVEEEYDVQKCGTRWEIGYVPSAGNCGHCPRRCN